MTPARRVEIDTRRAIVADRVAEGVPYRQIAVELEVGVSTITEDVKVIRKQWHERTSRTYDAHVAEMDAQIERLMRSWLPAANDPGLGEDARGAALVVHRLMERRAKLLGLDAPIRAELIARRTAPEREQESIRDRALRLSAEVQAYLDGRHDASVIDVQSSEGSDPDV